MKQKLVVCVLLLVCTILSAQNRPDRPEYDAKAKYVPGRVLVRFRPQRSEAARSSAHAALGARRLRSFRHVSALELVELADLTSVKEAIAQYRKNPDVLYAEPDYIVHAEDRTPNDPSFHIMWGLDNSGQQNGSPGADIAALKAWDLTTGSTDVVVGDIDSGVASTHPDLAPNLLSGAFFAGDELWDYVGHGTHTAGTIGALGNNGQGITGVNWRVSIVPCKFLTVGGGTTSAAIQCLDYVAGLKDSGVNVIATNNSWGGYGYSQALYDAIRQQMLRGILFIAAAGNDALDTDVYPHYPSSFDLPNIISVAATDRMDRLATFSNFGKHSVHVGAPGVGVLSTYPTASYQTLDGTSMATPHVTGVAALLKSYLPGLDWRGLKNRILASGVTLPSLSSTATSNRLNAYNALTCADRRVSTRLAPRSNLVTTVAGAHVPFSMLNIVCEHPAGNVTLTVEPSGALLELVDNGTGPDKAAGDGIYSADFIAPDSGTYTLRFPDGDAVQVQVLKPYKYERIASSYREITGTSLALDDETAKPLNLPFPVHIGGQTLDRIFVSSDGFVSLDYGYTSGSPYRLPYATLQTIIAPFWDDFAPHYDSTRNVYWAVSGTAPNRELVVEWRDVTMYGYDPGAPGSGATFQIVFHEDRDDILFNYKDVNVSAGPWWTSSGGAASVGIQVGPTTGTQFSLGTTSLSDGLSLRWTLAERDLILSVPTLEKEVFLSQGGVDFEVNVKSIYGLVTPVTLSCTAGAPDTCSTASLVPSAYGSTANLHVDSSTAGEYIFGIRAQADGLSISHEQQVTLKVVDFAVGSPTPAALSIANGGTTTFTAQISAAGPFTKDVTLSCSGISGATCAFSPSATVKPTASSPVSVTVTINMPFKLGSGVYNLNLSGASGGITRQVTVPVTVTPQPDFLLLPASDFVSANADSTAVDLTVDGQDSYSGTVRLSCSVTPAGPKCSVTPSTIDAYPSKAIVSIQQNNASAGEYQVTVSGEDGKSTRSKTIRYWIPDYTLTGPSTISYYRNSTQQAIFSLAWSARRDVRVTFACSAPAPVMCSANPSSISLSQYVSPTTIGVTLFASNTTTDFPLTLSVVENGNVMRSITVPVAMKGFDLTIGPRREQTVMIGNTSEPIDLTLTPFGGYDLPTTIQLWTCSYCSPNSITVTPNGKPQVLSFTAQPVANDRWIYGDASFGAVGQASIPGGSDTVNVSTYGQPEFKIHVQDFFVSFEAERISLHPGKSATLVVNTSGTNGFNLPIQLSCPTNLGPGITCTLAKTTLLPGESTTLTLATSSATPPSYREIALRGTVLINGLEVSRTATISAAIGRFAFTVEVPTYTVASGGAATFVVSASEVGIQSGVNNSARISCMASDPGVTCETALFTALPASPIYVDVRTTAGLTSVGLHEVTLTVEVGGEIYNIPLRIVMHGPNSLVLTAPNGYDLWTSGKHNITWNFTGNPGETVRLELLKNDVFDRVIADNVAMGAEGKGYYEWEVPDSFPFSQWYKVRVVSNSQADIYDASDRRFWVGRGGEIISPSGGQTYQFGSYEATSIFYTWSGVGAYTWELYSKDDNFIAKVAETDISGYFNINPDWRWGVPLSLPNGTPPGEYKLKMIPRSDPARATWNPGGAFRLIRSTAVISSPAKGENFKPGQTISVRWNLQDLPPGVVPSDVQINLLQGSYYVQTISNSVQTGADGTGSFSWAIPADIAQHLDYRISVRMYGEPFLNASTETFSIGTFHNLGLKVEGAGNIRTADSTLYCSSECTTALAAGTTITLIATESIGYKFAGWSGACTGTGTECTVLMDSDKSVGARFVSTSPDFEVTGTPGQVTVASGDSGTFSAVLKALNGFSSTVSLSCSDLPSYASCSFSEKSATPSAEGKSLTVTVSTRYTATAAPGNISPRAMLGLGLSLPIAGIIIVPGSRRRRILFAVLLTLMVASLLSCGGGSGPGKGNDPGNPPTYKTPAGTYNIKVNATGGNMTHSTTVTLVVR